MIVSTNIIIFISASAHSVPGPRRNLLKRTSISRMGTLDGGMGTHTLGTGRRGSTEDLPPVTVANPLLGSARGHEGRRNVNGSGPPGRSPLYPLHVDDRGHPNGVRCRSINVGGQNHIVRWSRGVQRDGMSLEILYHCGSVFKPQVLYETTSHWV
jgi:hypothetical protein